MHGLQSSHRQNCLLERIMSSKQHRGESTSPNKPVDSQLCSTCNKLVSDDALECIWCESLQHRSGARISDIVLSDLPQ